MEMFVLLDAFNGTGANAIVGVTFDRALAVAHGKQKGCAYKETKLKE